MKQIQKQMKERAVPCDARGSIRGQPGLTCPLPRALPPVCSFEVNPRQTYFISRYFSENPSKISHR